MRISPAYAFAAARGSLRRLRPTRAVSIELDEQSPFAAPETRRLLATAARPDELGDLSGLLGSLQRLLIETSPFAEGYAHVTLMYASVLLEAFKRSPDRERADTCLAAFEQVGRSAALPVYAVHHEVGRANYEIGRRLDDPAMLREAVERYSAARSVAARRSDKRDVKSKMRDAASCYHAIVCRGIPDSSEPRHVAHILIPIDSIPVERACLVRRGWVGTVHERSFCTAAAGRGLTVTLIPPAKPRRNPNPAVDARGREDTGRKAFTVQQDVPRTNAMRAVIRLEGGADGAEALLKQLAPELRLWGDRVSRWLDVLSQQAYGDSHTMTTSYLYGHLVGSGQTRALRLFASKDDLNMRTLDMSDPLERHEVAFVLDHLAPLPIPTAFEMIRNAETSLSVGDPLRSVVESGTAAEAALCTRYDDLADDTKPREERWTLGRLVSELAHIPEGLPSGVTQNHLERVLVKPRNDAVHRGVANDRSAIEALQAGRTLVHHAYGFGDEDFRQLAASLTRLQPVYAPFESPGTGFALDQL